MKLTPQLSLEELQQAFAQWRQTRQPRSVPTELRFNARALLNRHGTTEVLRTLGINHSMLSRWKHHYEATPDAEAGFVALPVSAEPSRSVEVAEPIPAPPEATPLRLTIRREAEALALSGELSLAQWRAALSLLGVGR